MRITREGSKVARTRLQQKMIMEAADHAAGMRRRLPQEQQERHSNDEVGQEVTIDCILEQKESIMGAPDQKQSIRSLTRQLLQQEVSALSASSMSTTSSSQDDNVNDGRSKDSTTPSEEVSQNVDHLVTRRLQRHHPFLHKAVALRTASSSSVSSCAASASSSSFLQQGSRFFSSE